MPTDFIALFSVLSTARIRFVVVGGLAVLLHGLDRLTADVDLIIDLSTDAARDAVRALIEAGYRPLAPVDPAWLADPVRRAEWQTQRGMQVFSFWDSTNTRPTVDVMLSPPVPFEELWADAVSVPVAGTTVKVASIAHLIHLKQAAGRPQDLADIERLRALLKSRE
jgi:predicted nucleotidyltransferase